MQLKLWVIFNHHSYLLHNLSNFQYLNHHQSAQTTPIIQPSIHAPMKKILIHLHIHNREKNSRRAQ